MWCVLVSCVDTSQVDPVVFDVGLVVMLVALVWGVASLLKPPPRR